MNALGAAMLDYFALLARFRRSCAAGVVAAGKFSRTSQGQSENARDCLGLSGALLEKKSFSPTHFTNNSRVSNQMQAKLSWVVVHYSTHNPICHILSHRRPNGGRNQL